MKDHLKQRFAEATKLKEKGDLSAAREIMLELSEIDPDSPAISAVLGHVFWEMQLLNEAITAFRRAVELAPNLEAASLGLFHCLWESGKREEALEEAKRFTSISGSDTYMEMVREITQKYE